MRRTFCILLCLVLILPATFAQAQADMLAFNGVPDIIKPGGSFSITFSSVQSAVIELTVLNELGTEVAVIAYDYDIPQGQTMLSWDGIYNGEALPAGTYSLQLSSQQSTITSPLVIDEPLPIFTQVMFSDHIIVNETPLSIVIATNLEAKLSFSLITNEGSQHLGSGMVSSSASTIIWDGKLNGEPLPSGDYILELTLRDPKTDEVSVNEHYTIGIWPESIDQASPLMPIDENAFTTQIARPIEAGESIKPSHYSEWASPPADNSYWNLPMDITNEEAVWEMLMSPIYVLDGEQKKQTRLMSEPDENSQPIADVTYASQGIRVLENLDNGWSLVETYSSSFYNSKVKAWNKYVQGYVKTKLIKEKTPGNKEYGMVVDKLTQRLYVFKNGKMIAELLASTGLPSERQPYNETRSGEFLLLSAVGEFRSDNMFCSYAIRFNGGDLLHEVPHLINADGTFNYRNTEPKLGLRASHGCIRIQRLKNPDGINMKWIWNEIYKGISSKTVKLVVWEDFPGRQMAIPDGATPLYYNPEGGSSYHSRESCNGVREKYLPLTPFTYSELEQEPYSQLTACNYCVPPLRIADINEINQAHQVQ